VAEEDKEPRQEADIGAKCKLMKQIRRELTCTEQGCAAAGGEAGGASNHVGSSTEHSGATCKKHRRPSKVARLVEKADPLGPEWAAVRDVPPVDINRLEEPTGAFLDHMKPYVFDCGSYTFPWDLNWNRQSPELKVRFIFRLRKLYPGPWEAKAMLNLLGNNLRKKRNRLKRRFRIYSNPKAVTRPKGCTLQSWEQIYHDLRDPKKKAKSDLCKMKAHERITTGSPFSHRTGRGGYRGIVAKFVSECRVPNVIACGRVGYCRSPCRSWGQRRQRCSDHKRVFERCCFWSLFLRNDSPDDVMVGGQQCHTCKAV
jgi:hypothetical protein